MLGPQEFNDRVEALLDAALAGSARARRAAPIDWYDLRYDCELFEAELNAAIAEHNVRPFDQAAYWRHGARCLGPFDGRVLQLPEAASAGAWYAFVGTNAEAMPPLGRIGARLLADSIKPVLAPRLEDLAAGRQEPDVLLVSLYHPENFPLPRFALGISDLARSIRSRGLGRVRLRDMQLDLSASAIVEEIRQSRPDIVGISATFGQNDVLSEVLDQLRQDPRTSQATIIVGGSLAALNADNLVERGLLVATGPGEQTMVGVVEHHCGLRLLESVPGLRFAAPDGDAAGPVIDNRFATDFLPELDLVHATLGAKGAIQLESSRGCSYACSFCPRDHKGIWSGKEAATIDSTIRSLAELFARHPDRARKLFLVDEEFVGYRPDSERRALEVAELLHANGFAFETNARVDQVARENRPAEWHAERVRLWRRLVTLGLERCLFGVESGIDSILKRFNKKTTQNQNVRAIRTLTAAGVPIRFTYITFDPLMSLDELVASYRFLSRSDLVIPASRGLSDEAIVALSRSDRESQAAGGTVPLYREISYQLVSMEALIGSPYLRMVEDAGLAGPWNLNMGRRDARYRDDRIGIMSAAAQLWIDRNFSADYFLKGLEKVVAAELRSAVRKVRAIFKDYAHALLGVMLGSVTDQPLPVPLIAAHFSARRSLFDGRWPAAGGLAAAVPPPVRELMDDMFVQLVGDVDTALAGLLRPLEQSDPELARRARLVFDPWRTSGQWNLINAL